MKAGDLINVGDVLYKHRPFRGLFKQIVISVTNKLATLDNGTIVKREVVGYGMKKELAVIEKLANLGCCWLETDTLKSDYELQELRNKVERIFGSFNYSKLSKTQCEQFITLCESLKTEK